MSELEQKEQLTAEIQEDVAEETPKKKRRWRPTRRGFLIGAGVTGAAVALGAVIGKPYVHLQMAEMIDSGDAGAFGSSTEDPNLWFEVADDSHIRLFVPQVEMGQGVHTLSLIHI